MLDIDEEEFRHRKECEFWWRETNGNKDRIAEVLQRVALKRSPAGTEKLRQGLLEMYREAGK